MNKKESLSLIQDLMQKLDAAKYDEKILTDEDNDLRNFAEGYNRCIAHIQVMLIMNYGAKPTFKPKTEQEKRVNCIGCEYLKETAYMGMVIQLCTENTPNTLGTGVFSETTEALFKNCPLKEK